MSYFIDSHCHLHPPWFDNDKIENVMHEASLSNVNKIISCASDPAHFEFVSNTFRPEKLYLTLGIQPTEAEIYRNVEPIVRVSETKDSRTWFKAIGEVGLDYHWVKDQKLQNLQRELFLDAIRLANEVNYPLVIHSRKAEQDCLDILEKFARTPVLLHSFEGNLELINRAKDLGYLISIPTNVVIRKNRRKVAKRAGIDNLMLETDSPYCAPIQDLFPNTPKNIPLAAEKLAEILNIEYNEIMRVTTRNAENFYQI